jgi:hypothetical protein
VADVHRVARDTVDVVVSARDARRGEVELFRRRFVAGETSEIRLILHGGADSARVHGAAARRIGVRVVGGGGADILVDDVGGSHLYDVDPDDRFVRGPGTDVNTRAFEPPPVTPSPLNRDWGTQRRTLLWLAASPDVGVLAGVGVEHYDFAFRTVPWRSRLRLRAGWATGANTYRVEASLRVHEESSPVFWQLEASASGLEILRFHGFGNETRLTRPERDYRVEQSEFALVGQVALQRPGLVASFGPVLEFARTSEPPAWLPATERPYGMGDFGQIGLGGNVLVDGRDRERAATTGAMVHVEGELFPALWDVDRPFGRARGNLTAYLSPWQPLRPTLALRLGAEKVFGRYPFHEAAYLGDAETVRLGREQRFAGDALAHANGELRLKLSRAVLVVPADVGVFALWDVGRVWYEGERSDRWHDARGGGVWLAFLRPENVVSLALVQSGDGVGLYLGGGFAY